ncbi:MAG TPA: VgrG-related protein [Anaerolineaceae bacterium]
MPDVITIKVNGTAQDDLHKDLIEVVVDTSIYLPAMFTILLNDDESTGSYTYIDTDTPFKIGAEVTIEITDPATSVSKELVKGEVTGLEPVFSSTGSVTLLVRGYDRCHRMMRGTKTRVFANMTDADIFSQIASEAGGSGSADSSFNTQNVHLFQYNQSDWEFINERARRLGAQVFADGATFNLKKADNLKVTTKPELEWPLTLTSFEPRLSVVGMVNTVKFSGWDPGTKTAVTAQATSDSSQMAPARGWQKGSALVQTAFSSSTATVVETPLQVSDVATKMANARFTDYEAGCFTAEGAILTGNPDVKAGMLVTVKGVGTRFTGDYYVTSARHVYTGGGYQTTFTVSGRSPDTLRALLAADTPQFKRVEGVVIGVVTNVNDPDDTGRVKVKYPWLDDTLESDWIRIASPMAGAQRGFYYLPEVNDEVLVAFQHGDINFPFIVGCLWSKVDKPPAAIADAVKDGKVVQRVIKTRAGHVIILDDTQGSEQIIIKDKTTKNSMTIKSSDNSIALVCDGNMTIEAKGTLSMKSTGAMTIESSNNSTIKATQNLTLEATQNGSFKGTAGLTLESPASSTLKGTNLTVEGTAQAAVKGALVDISASGIAQLKGALVKIN